MTDKRIEKLKTIIAESRARLLERNPSFALLLMYLRFVAVPNMKKISTDGVTIFFNPQFLEKLSLRELDYVLCHQIMHIVFGHVETTDLGDADLEDYHFACDIFINDNLFRAGFPLDRFTRLGELCRNIPWRKEFGVTDRTEQEIYKALPLSLSFFDEKIRNRFLVDVHDFWNGCYTIKKEDTVIIDFPRLESTTDLEIDRQEEGAGDQRGVPSNGGAGGGTLGGGNSPLGDGGLKSYMYAALKTTQNSFESDDKNVWERVLGNRKKAILDWRKLLIGFLQEEINDYSFSPPDRRYDDSPFFLPDFNEKDYIVKEILFMVDTSSSISKQQLTAVFDEMCGVVEQFNGKINGKIAFFDDAVYPAVAFESVKDILGAAPLGGGGTSFDILFDYVQEDRNHNKPSCIIIFTDGEADYPDEEEAMGIPVFWIINNTKNTPPWGRVARMFT